MRTWRRVRHPITEVAHILVSGKLITPCGMIPESDWKLANARLDACRFCEKALEHWRKNGRWPVKQR